MPRRRAPLAVLALASLAALLAGPPAHAQPEPARPAEASDLRRVVLLDGTVLVGTIDDEGADPLVVRTAGGIEQRVPQAQVRTVSTLYEGRFTRLDPNRTRLFFTPTGRTLGRGSGRFSAYYLFPSVAYGVTDRVDLSVGATIPALSSDGDFAAAINLNGKVQLARLGGGGLAAGASAIIPIASGDLGVGVGGTVYGLATLGSETQAVTFGVVGFYGTDFEEAEVADGALLVVGYERQLSSSIKFITENGLLVGDGGVPGGGTLTGVRFFGDRLAADVAVLAVAGDGDFYVVPFPYLGLSYNFGR